MTRVLSLLPAACLGLALIQARAQDVDLIATSLDKAKAAYDTRDKAYREGVLKELQTRYERLAKKGAVADSKQVEAQIAEFEKNPDARPSSSLPQALRKKRSDALRGMIEAYRKAVVDNTKARQKDKADEVEREMADFKKSHGVYSLSDVLSPGAVLEGDLVFMARQQNHGELRLTITERMGKRFMGRHRVRFAGNPKPAEVEVRGEIDGDSFRYETVDRANYFTVGGALNDDRIDAEFNNPTRKTQARCTLKVPAEFLP